MLVYRASDMILEAQTDASYLSRSRSRSVVGGLGYLGSGGFTGTPNGAIFTHSADLDVVVASPGEAEYGAAFTIAQKAEFSRIILTAIGHPQPATVLFCDNKCAVGLANDAVKQRHSKSVDMRYHWLRDRVCQGHFNVTWLSGKNILADFFIKPLPVHRHQKLMTSLVCIPIAAPEHFLNARLRLLKHSLCSLLPVCTTCFMFFVCLSISCLYLLVTLLQLVKYFRGCVHTGLPSVCTVCK